MDNADASFLDGFAEPLPLVDRSDRDQIHSPPPVPALAADAAATTTDAPARSAATYARLLTLPALDEPAWKRWLFTLCGLAIAGAFLFFVMSFFAPGPGAPGIDENAYLVGGKEVAHHFTPGIHPSTPYGYVGPMWVRAADGWYYPKYPAGVPLLDAVAIWIGGGHNNLLATYVSPVCAALAVLAMFLLTRTMAGSFLALLGAIALACNSTMLHLALIPSSHAPDICFVLWGMYALICWWKSGKIWVGFAAGFLLGYAVTIRYSEALLLFPLYPIEIDKLAHPIGHKLFYIVRFLPLGPLGLAVIASMRWKKLGSYLRAAVPLIAWAIPVGMLVWFNWRTLHTLTGYDPTHESTGFTLKEFDSKWEYTIQELYMYGMFFLLPMGILGMMLMFSRAWRMALLMVLWFVPSVILYTAYYWGEQSPGVGYLRFFLALFPPIIASAMWLIGAAGRGLMVRQNADKQWTLGRGSFAIPIGAGIFTAAVAAAGVYVSLPDMERQHVQNEKLAYSAHALLQSIPAATHHSGKPDPIFFADDEGMFSRLLMYMQFAGDGEWYSTDAFTLRGAESRGMGGGRNRGGGNGGGRGFPAGGPNAQADPDQQQAPVLFDPVRVKFHEQAYSKKSPDGLRDVPKTADDLRHEEIQMLGAALDSGRPIYAMLSAGTAFDFSRRLLLEGFDAKKIANWKEPADTMAEAEDGVVTPPTPAPTRSMFGFGNAGGGNGFGRNRQFNGGGGGGPGGGGRGGGGPGGGFDRNQGAAGLSPPARGMGRMGETTGQQTLEVLQITRHPAPKPKPTIAPTTPAAKPATRPAALPVAVR